MSEWRLTGEINILTWRMTWPDRWRRIRIAETRDDGIGWEWRLETRGLEWGACLWSGTHRPAENKVENSLSNLFRAWLILEKKMKCKKIKQKKLFSWLALVGILILKIIPRAPVGAKNILLFYLYMVYLVLMKCNRKGSFITFPGINTSKEFY